MDNQIGEEDKESKSKETEHWIAYHLKAMEYPQNKFERKMTLILKEHHPRERMRKQKQMLDWFRNIMKYHREKLSMHFVPGKTYVWFDELCRMEASFDIQWMSIPQPSRKATPLKISRIVDMRQKLIAWYKNEIQRICKKAIASIPVTDKTKKTMEFREKENKCYETLFVTASDLEGSVAKK